MKKIKIKDLEIFNNQVKIGDLKKESHFSFQYLDDVILNYEQRNISFDYLSVLSLGINFPVSYKTYCSGHLSYFGSLISNFPEGFLLEKIKQKLENDELYSRFEIV